MYLRSELRAPLIRSFFFFQAEDGIRDLIVTGVQTCALPICVESLHSLPRPVNEVIRGHPVVRQPALSRVAFPALVKRNERSEERRVGKECRSRWSPYH